MNGKFIIPIIWLVAAMSFSSLSYAETVWIDVRSPAEHAADSIEGDILISHDEIVRGVTKRFSDKSTDIHLYCASGVRSGRAMSALEEAGYTNVSNVGGIDDAREQRGIEE